MNGNETHDSHVKNEKVWINLISSGGQGLNSHGTQ